MRVLNAAPCRLAAIAFLALAAAAPAAPAATTTISHAALKSLFPGSFSVSVRGISARFVASSNGRLTGTSIAGTDTGRWSVRGGRLCIMLADLFDGQTRCSAVVREGGWYRADTVRFRKI